MEHIEFSCPPGELSCIIGNLFVSLEPPCKYVRSTHLMLCGITHSGNNGRLIVLGDRCSFYGLASDLDAARNGPWMRLADCHDAYCWHISDLRVYKKPKSLFDFHRAVDEDELWCEKCAVGGKKSTSCGFCYGLDGLRIRRPPQSWCYVAENEENV